MFDLVWYEWCWLVVAALGIGIAKSGLSGVSMVHVLVFAAIFDAQRSTGIVLPMLIVGDVGAILLYGQHANWPQVRKMIGPALIGVILGWQFMKWLPSEVYRPLIGLIILGLALLQIARLWSDAWQEKLPHSKAFAWSMGSFAGITTMLANAAGPIFSLYLLALSIPKLEFVGTSAWFFLIINSIKVPFSFQLGLIDWQTLSLNAILFPLVFLGLFLGKKIVVLLPQKAFDSLILVFAAIAAIWLLSS